MHGILVIALHSFGVGFSGAVMPGPMFAATVSSAVRKGRWAGLRIVLGHVLLEALLVMGLVFGLGPWLLKFESWIAVVGGLLLLLMGLDMLRNATRAADEIERAEGSSSLRGQPEALGVITTLTNPYFFIWWATIGLALITASLKAGLAGVVAFYLGHILSDFVWFGLVGFGIGTSRTFFSARVIRAVLVVCAVAICGLGLWFLVSGLGREPAPESVEEVAHAGQGHGHAEFIAGGDDFIVFD